MSVGDVVSAVAEVLGPGELPYIKMAINPHAYVEELREEVRNAENTAKCLSVLLRAPSGMEEEVLTAALNLAEKVGEYWAIVDRAQACHCEDVEQQARKKIDAILWVALKKARTPGACHRISQANPHISDVGKKASEKLNLILDISFKEAIKQRDRWAVYWASSGLKMRKKALSQILAHTDSPRGVRGVVKKVSYNKEYAKMAWLRLVEITESERKLRNLYKSCHVSEVRWAIENKVEPLLEVKLKETTEIGKCWQLYNDPLATEPFKQKTLWKITDLADSVGVLKDVYCKPTTGKLRKIVFEKIMSIAGLKDLRGLFNGMLIHPISKEGERVKARINEFYVEELEAADTPEERWAICGKSVYASKVLGRYLDLTDGLEARVKVYSHVNRQSPLSIRCIREIEQLKAQQD